MAPSAKSTDNYVFATSTDEVILPDDFVVEFFLENDEIKSDEISSFKIKSLDELIDFLEKMPD
ncbi:MAG TPA: hypothetical protein DCR24_10805 [Bacillus bacterium]|nr:hypothetical protein [Bacillus sp. (in: firmicutes)]